MQIMVRQNVASLFYCYYNKYCFPYFLICISLLLKLSCKTHLITHLNFFFFLSSNLILQEWIIYPILYSFYFRAHSTGVFWNNISLSFQLYMNLKFSNAEHPNIFPLKYKLIFLFVLIFSLLILYCSSFLVLRLASE